MRYSPNSRSSFFFQDAKCFGWVVGAVGVGGVENEAQLVARQAVEAALAVTMGAGGEGVGGFHGRERWMRVRWAAAVAALWARSAAARVEAAMGAAWGAWRIFRYSLDTGAQGAYRQDVPSAGDGALGHGWALSGSARQHRAAAAAIEGMFEAAPG